MKPILTSAQSSKHIDKKSYSNIIFKKVRLSTSIFPASSFDSEVNFFRKKFASVHALFYLWNNRRDDVKMHWQHKLS